MEERARKPGAERTVRKKKIDSLGSPDSEFPRRFSSAPEDLCIDTPRKASKGEASTAASGSCREAQLEPLPPSRLSEQAAEKMRLVQLHIELAENKHKMKEQSATKQAQKHVEASSISRGRQMSEDQLKHVLELALAKAEAAMATSNLTRQTSAEQYSNSAEQYSDSAEQYSCRQIRRGLRRTQSEPDLTPELMRPDLLRLAIGIAPECVRVSPRSCDSEMHFDLMPLPRSCDSSPRGSSFTSADTPDYERNGHQVDHDMDTSKQDYDMPSSRTTTGFSTEDLCVLWQEVKRQQEVDELSKQIQELNEQNCEHSCRLGVEFSPVKDFADAYRVSVLSRKSTAASDDLLKLDSTTSRREVDSARSYRAASAPFTPREAAFH